MIDMHFDLLTIIYECYLRMDYSYLEEVMKNFNPDNVSKVIANMYFMSKSEMLEEFGSNYTDINVVEMFKIAKDILSKYMPLNKVILSIEGCGYINNLEELEELYDLGLRNILLVWNNPNKYGSGKDSENGLTDLGRKFLIKAIDLGICIDVSHMNKKTFYDTVEVLKEQKKLGKKVKVIASHSNCYKICSNQRNLNDEEILSLKEFKPVIGVVSYSEFVLDSRATQEQLNEYYVKHIEHLKELVGIDCIGVASDDMLFEKDLFDREFSKQVFEYSNIKNSIIELLKDKFSDEEIEKILYKNINKLLWEEL